MICCTRLEEAISDKLVAEIEKEKPYIYPQHNFEEEDIYTLVKNIGNLDDEGWTDYYYFKFCPWCGTELTR